MNGDIQRPIRFALHKTSSAVHCSGGGEREKPNQMLDNFLINDVNSRSAKRTGGK